MQIEDITGMWYLSTYFVEHWGGPWRPRRGLGPEGCFSGGMFARPGRRSFNLGHPGRFGGYTTVTAVVTGAEKIIMPSVNNTTWRILSPTTSPAFVVSIRVSGSKTGW